MDIRQLKYFICVAEHLNFTEASKQLFIAQSAISNQIKDLEEKIGVKLFHRDKRSVQLTSAGKVFLKEAQYIVSRSNQAIEITRKAEKGIIGNLNIGFLSPSVRSFLPKIINDFRKQYPMIDINLDHYDSGFMNEAILSNDIDIAFTASFGFDNIAEIKSMKLHKEKFLFVVNTSHHFANRESIHLDEIKNEPLVIFSKDEEPRGYDFIMKMCALHDFTPNFVSQTRNMETIYLLVETGIGAAFLPCCLKHVSGGNLCFIDIDEAENSFDIIASWRKSNDNPAIPKFLELLQEMNVETVKY